MRRILLVAVGIFVFTGCTPIVFWAFFGKEKPEHTRSPYPNRNGVYVNYSAEELQEIYDAN